jgi:hypothetical protein
MERRTIAVGLTVASLAALALGGSAAIASNSQTFTDSTGEDPAAPDITSVAVSNDDSGLVTFQVNVPNRPSLTQDMLFLVFVDSVQGTGDPESLGADYAIQLEPSGVALFKWNGSDYLFQSTPSLSYTYGTGGPTFRVNASGLGAANGARLNFIVLAISGITTDANGDLNFDTSHADLAPDRGRGTYSYDVKMTFSLKPAGFTTSPAPARAGQAFSVGLAATQSDTGGFVQKADIACTATIGGKRVPVKTRRLVNGVSACVWQLPKTAKGKTIRGTITVSTQGAKLKRSFSARIS